MKIILVFLSIFLLASCGPVIYKSQNASTIISKHKTVAILPADITWNLDKIDSRKIPLEKINESERRSGLYVQSQMAKWLNENKEKYFVKFQNIEETNQLLYESGLKYSDVRSTSKLELAKFLKVDALIFLKIVSDKPMSDAELIFLSLPTGTFGEKPDSRLYTTIFDGSTGQQLWRYDYSPSNLLGMRLDRIVKNAMINSSKRFPYKK